MYPKAAQYSRNLATNPPFIYSAITAFYFNVLTDCDSHFTLFPVKHLVLPWHEMLFENKV